MMKDDWALVVGINNYPLAGVDPLQGAVRDAEAFFNWVTRPLGGDVSSPGQALLLTSPAIVKPKSAPRPIFSEIDTFFADLQATLTGTHGRRLYVYLSGHGISPTGQASVRNAALLMANAMPPDRWHNFAGNIWAAGARDTALFREVVLIMDCCRDINNNAIISSHPFGGATADGRDCLLIEAYATGWASKAREIPLPPDNVVKGVFTYSLLRVLDAGRMTGSLLKESVKKQLAITLKDEKRAQEPQIERDEDLAKVIFNEQAEPPITQVTIRGFPGGQKPTIEIWENNQSKSLPLTDWVHDDIADCWQGSLSPGKYELRLPAGGGRLFSVLAGIPEEVNL